MKKLLTILLSLTYVICSGQKQANVWYFGNHAGVDFNNYPPTPLLNGQTYFISASRQWNEGCSSICDSSGSLLFYTNGVNVWNKNQLVMPNGDSLKGHVSSTQSSIIVPKPASSRYFYVFTTDALENDFINGLRYSVVDMCLNGGLGDVISTEKNIKLIDTVSEKLICIRHSNGNDYWIITHKLNSDAYYSIRLTSTGIIDTVISHTATPDFIGIGQIKSSPNGQKIANATPNGYDIFGGFHQGFTTLCDFNSTTGVISNEQILPPSAAKTDYAVSFSPDNSKLYFSTIGHGEVYQYNMSAGSISAIIASKTNILNGPDSWRQIQLGPDGKLYLSRTGKSYLSEIEYPNSLFPTCNYIDSAIYLGGKFASLGLPNYIAGFDYSNTIVNCGSSEGINENIDESIVTIYPNPINAKLNVQVNNYEQTEIILYDLSSRKLLQQTFTNTTTINTEQLAKGMYLYTVRNRNGIIKNGKVIKQ